MNKSLRRWLVPATAALASALLLPASEASNKITVETISDYTFISGGSTVNNTDANVEGDGFWNAMTAAGTGWVTGVRFKDNLVFDTDFFDPDLTANTRDADTFNFDSAGTGISFAIGHGTCDDVSTTRCSTDSNCGSGAYCAPAGSALGLFESRACISQLTRNFVTSSSSSSHGNFIRYGKSFGGSALRSFALGESPQSGAFNGAGTNGGTNVAVIVNSCGFRSRYYLDETTFFFGGVHSLMVTMPTSATIDAGGARRFSDTAQWSSRGSTFANLILANQFAAASDAWLNPTMLRYVGGSRPFGANFVLARDNSSSRTIWHRDTESWIGAQIDSNDALGNGFWAARWVCNYDCNTLGF